MGVASADAVRVALAVGVGSRVCVGGWVGVESWVPEWVASVREWGMEGVVDAVAVEGGVGDRFSLSTERTAVRRRLVAVDCGVCKLCVELNTCLFLAVWDTEGC